MNSPERMKPIDEKRLTLIRFLSKLENGRDGEPLARKEKKYVKLNIKTLESDIAELQNDRTEVS